MIEPMEFPRDDWKTVCARINERRASRQRRNRLGNLSRALNVASIISALCVAFSILLLFIGDQELAIAIFLSAVGAAFVSLLGAGVCGFFLHKEEVAA